ncbi:exodeoxyribonuclease I [Aestuariicella hydrocarbonica]|uniref:Exodeoxyribonuclease I n=1 Tax=Pseudomaricurvus hydrocarbonicus TaxID=1470433 RepID=A0A9E5JRL2_9GAMM|nr:exodeoxyribonuclease I [Aestuariicella hydrocarbonica]NHO64054.1 exodeoxyribonuclease I [Aestuariicella hydrocarbonica]
MKTLYWHDYETWGEVPSKDRPSQFAGIRTDEDLNIIGAPLVIYCQPTRDVLPKPEACLVTGITPQKALAEGLSEPEFIAAIHAELSMPGTCGVGYNSLRFDDEVTRYTLYRNFYDPYEREWRNGNSRWDIIDMVRLTRALRPDGIEWPNHEDGKPSFKLEHITAANGIGHEAAHDALSDVHATIAVAKLIKDRQPALYDHIYQLRSKKKVTALIDVVNRKPLLHISSMFSADNGCAAIVAPLAMHPTNKNAVIVCNLSVNPEPLIKLSAEELAEKLYTPTADLAEGEERVPLKLVHLNKCPVLTTVKLLDDAAAERLKIDKALCERHWQQLHAVQLKEKLQKVYGGSSFSEPVDPEQRLYGGFLKDGDKYTCERVRHADADTFAAQHFVFEDDRLTAMLLRYRARYFPQSLSPDELQDYEQWRQDWLTNPEAGAGITLSELYQRTAALREERELTPQQHGVLTALEDYAATLL